MTNTTPFITKEFRPVRRDNAAKRQFNLEPWCEISFEGGEEWAVKRFLPRRGLAAIYGKPGSLKSFVAFHIGLCMASGRQWGGRRIFSTSVIYIAAEGAGGLRKRKAGYALTWPDIRDDLPFYLISAAPNLGAAPGDLPNLIADIEAANVAPGLIILDTLAQTLGAGDENGAGMTAFAANAEALAARFNALVLTVHHVGLGETAQTRMRGHSSLHGALDAQILCERAEGELAATLTLQKLKDEASDLRLTVRLSRVAVGTDEDGDEISTLVVDAVDDAEAPTEAPKPKPVPPSQRLLMSVVMQAIDASGRAVKPFENGPMVKAVSEQQVRVMYFARMAETADADENPGKLYQRQRKNFRNAVAGGLKAQSLAAQEIDGERFIWKA